MISNLNNLTKNLLKRGFCVFLIFLSINSNAQEGINEKKVLKQARKLLVKEKYKDAQEKYLKLVNSSPTNSIYNFEAGLSYFFATYERGKSTPLFEAAIENLKEDEDTIPEMYYYLGKSYQLNSEFEKSSTTFTKFDPYIAYGKKAGDELKNEIIDETNYNDNGIKYTTEIDKNIKILNLGNSINTLDREYAPVLYKKDNVLLFTSRRKINGNKIDKSDLLPYEDIYVAKETENGWTMITDQNEIKKYLPDNVNTKKHDASITYSLDEKTLYTYKKDAIWESTYDGTSWSSLTKLADNVNASKFNVPSVTLTADGNTAFFVSEKKDGIGGKDIYKSTKSSNGEWSEPTLLSTNINSAKDEDAPYLTEDGKTLFFSSKGHTSIGGYDIFKSELVNEEWSTPENLGIPINSPADDIYYTADVEQKNGFFSSSREGGNGDMDLYAFTFDCENLENTEIRGIAYNNKTKQPLIGKLTLTSKKDNKVVSTVTSNENGIFLLVTKPENDYNLSIEVEGFQKHTISIHLPKQCEYYQQYSEIALEQIEIDSQYYQVATLRNSFFDVNTEIDNYKKTGTLETNTITNELPFVIDGDKEVIALSRTLDPTNTELNYTVVSDTIKTNKPTETVAGVEIPSFENIYFDFDKSTLKTESKKELNKIIDFLKSENGKTVSITVNGHTDGKRDMEFNKKLFAKRNIPFTVEDSEKRSKEYNMELSKKRADNAVKYLTSKGINKNKITVNYNGENKPAAPNTNADGSDNPDNRAKNRRVSFSFSNSNVL
ncbi:MAG: OmpA family protein [Flavobacteriales bacterium]|nr:OmpA family protein [Flavobacteriales bacterium]MCB9364085.1 OmpA family protein [Flavobacteriales bacterium]